MTLFQELEVQGKACASGLAGLLLSSLPVPLSALWPWFLAFTFPPTAQDRLWQGQADFSLQGCFCTASLLGTFLAGTRKQSNWIQSIPSGDMAPWSTAFIGAGGPLLTLFIALQSATKPAWGCLGSSFSFRKLNPPLLLPYSVVADCAWVYPCQSPVSGLLLFLHLPNVLWSWGFPLLLLPLYSAPWSWFRGSHSAFRSNTTDSSHQVKVVLILRQTRWISTCRVDNK